MIETRYIVRCDVCELPASFTTTYANEHEARSMAREDGWTTGRRIVSKSEFGFDELAYQDFCPDCKMTVRR